jgi:hypothetical protein
MLSWTLFLGGLTMLAAPLSAQDCRDLCSWTCIEYAEKKGDYLSEHETYATICNKWECCSCDFGCGRGGQQDPLASVAEIIEALEAAESASDWAAVLSAHGDRLLVSHSQRMAFIRSGCQAEGGPVAFVSLHHEFLEHLHAFGVKPLAAFWAESADRRAQDSEGFDPGGGGG